MKGLIIFLAVFYVSSVGAFAQGNAFSFQGRLNDGTNPANGRYDLEFKLFDAVTGGAQIGPTVVRPNTTLINGVFSTTLDFGAVAFQTPGATFIEIAVKPAASPNTYTTLGPRQQLTVVPFASRAQNSTNADNATNANTAQNSLRLGGNLASDYYTVAQTNTGFIRNQTTTQTSTNFNISGNGVINGNLSVGINQSIAGSQTVAGISNLAALNATGNVTQTRALNGFALYGLPKAMLYINQDGTIGQCYNGIIGTSAGNCGFTSQRSPALTGFYTVNLGYSVLDRFIVVTPQFGGGLSRIGAMFSRISTDPTVISVKTFFVNIDRDVEAGADNPFMIVVY